MAGENNSNGGGLSKQEASAKKPEGRGSNGVAVTAEDLALREDICYQTFGDVGPLIRDFSCAWDHKVVMHGRMYVTGRRLCFYANFFGLEAKMSLRHEDVARCSKGNSAIFIPNVVVVQDKSGKDFVFRAFWERDECHSLLEELRREAGDVLARAEQAKAKMLLQEADGDGGEDDRLLPPSGAPPDAAPGAGAGRRANSWDGEASRPAFQSNGGSGYPLLEDLSAATAPPVSPPPASVSQRLAPSALPRESSSSSSSEVSFGRRTRVRHSVSPPPVRTTSYSGGGGGGGASGSSSLPTSPRAMSTSPAGAGAGAAATTARGRSYSMTPGGDGGGGMVRASTIGSSCSSSGGGAVPPRPAKLGLAVLGADHDLPSPAPPPQPPPLYLNGDDGSGRRQQRQQRQGQQRPSPLATAVITGAGRAGWGSPEASCSSSRTGTPRGQQQQHDGDGHAPAKGVGAAAAATAGAAVEGAAELAKKTARTSGLEHREVGGNGGGVDGEVSEGKAQEQKEGEKDKQQAPEAGGRKAGLVRQGSKLWNMMRWDSGGRAGGAGDGGVDPEADKKAMEEAISAGGDSHAEVATAEFDVSVKEFYERFVADDAPYSLPDFHMSRGDWEVDAGEWQHTTKEGEGGGGAAGSTKGDGGGLRGPRPPGGGGVTRAIRFKTPLHITFMSSPGHVRTLKRQRSRVFGGQGCIVETQTTVEDRIPLSDNFHVEDRWIIRPAAEDEGSGSGGKPRCTATVTWRCVWHKFTVIKGLIEGKCRADVKSFNIAFLQGMREHLESEGARGIKRCPSLRDALLSVGSGRRISRDRSLSSRSLLSPFADSEDGDGGGGGGTGDALLSLNRSVEEWGRSSLALLDVREETRRLSGDLLQLDQAIGASRGGRRNAHGVAEAVDDLGDILREMEEKVKRISQRADGALEALNETASQIRDATACPPAATAGAAAGNDRNTTPCEDVCAASGSASGGRSS
ncbi:unnamed protein product [Ectocarpus sp. 6 AP-2014]